MKSNCRHFEIIFFVVLLLGTSSCKSNLKNGDTISFNDKNFSRYWEFNNVKHADDSIVMTSLNGSLVSKFKTADFEFTARLYTTGGAEGSVEFHTQKTGDSLAGYSVKINNSDYRAGSPQKTGSLSLIRNNFVRTADDNKWVTLRIEVLNKSIKVFVNDKIISEYTEPDSPVRISGLENRILGEGYLKISKSSEDGIIVLKNLTIESFEKKNAEDQHMAFSADSTNDLINILNQQEFPVIDFHGHLKGGLTVAQVTENGRMQGYNYGLAPNCGLNFPVTNDSSLLAYYYEMAHEPVFKAMQCEGREWITLFSPEAIAHFDYIFTDAMTWTDHKGRRLRLWLPEETFVDNEQQFMDMLVGKIEAELSQEPVDIFVNPTYLPESIAAQYDELWTIERMDRVIKVLVENDIAMEINSRFRIPSLDFVKRARSAGVKFTLGTNNAGNDDLGKLAYSLLIVREAGLTASDMFLPRPSGDKKVMKKGLPARITG